MRKATLLRLHSLSGFRRGPLLPVFLLVLTALLLCDGACSAEEPLYIENQWNFVDGSMDVAGGIPADAQGRLARIRDNGKLTVATEPYFPPQEFIDSAQTGQARFVGADMELARLIAARMGVELEIVPLPLNDVLSSVADGKYDLAISALSFTPARAASLEMSKGYYYTSEPASSGLVIRSDMAEEITRIEDLALSDIVAQSGSLQESMAADSILRYRQFRRVSSVEDVYRAIQEGKCDAGIVDIESASIYIEKHPDSGLALVPGISFALPAEHQGDRIAAPKGEIQLICFVNGVIDEALNEGLYEQWFEEYAHDSSEDH